MFPDMAGSVLTGTAGVTVSDYPQSQITPSLNAHVYSRVSSPMNCTSLSLSSWSFSAVVHILHQLSLQNIIVCVAFGSFRLNHLW